MANKLSIDAADPKIRDVYTDNAFQAPARGQEARAVTPDPMVGVLSAFSSIPAEYHANLFNDFREAAEAKDLRRLLDTISDWAATAELYADEHLAQEVQQAIAGRREVTDWRHGYTERPRCPALLAEAHGSRRGMAGSI